MQFILIRIWFVAHCNLTFGVGVDFISGGAERTRQTSRQVRQVGYIHFLSAYVYSLHRESRWETRWPSG